MNSRTVSQKAPLTPSFLKYLSGVLALSAAFFVIEIFAFIMLKPDYLTGLCFGALWSLLLSCLLLSIPRKVSRILFGIVYFVAFVWSLAQIGYHHIFDKLMWISTVGFAGEGTNFLDEVIYDFPALWWVGLVCMLALGIILLKKFPHAPAKFLFRLPYLICSVIFLVALCFFPRLVFLRDNNVWGTHSEYGQSSSVRATYTTMYDAKKVYNITGLYQLTLRDVWVNELYPLTPAYQTMLNAQTAQVDAFFAQRDEHADNAMTGIFAGKNVVYVLMESMDDWMITPEDTPTIHRMMKEGINFTNFYTPGFGNARTLNSEFCMNTGIYLPTTGSFVFDYVTNSFKQSIASQLNANGYSSLVFHYNDPAFYSRGVFEPAMGYGKYVHYGDYVEDEERLYEENLLFDLPEVNDLFFREGPTFNTIITRSAHLSYKYNELLSHYALKLYPQYKGLYNSEEEDCARVKAKLVDDMFARLLAELESHGQLENTVIIAMTDHYTYGYKNMDELYAHSGVSAELLLEKTPCFIWSANGPSLEVYKTLNTADLLPTVLNLLGIDSPYNYLGQDAFDPTYEGYVIFPDGSWIRDGVIYQEGNILQNETGRTVSQEEIDAMASFAESYRTISNLLLTCNYYR